MHLKAPAFGMIGILAGYGNQALASAFRKNRRRIVNAVSVISERPLKWRSLSNRPVDQVASFRMLQRINIGFTGHKQLRRGGRELAQNGMTPDDHDVTHACNSG